MKILYIYTAFSTKGGADRVLIDKMNYLSSHGFDVVAVTDSQNGRDFAYPLSSQVKHFDLQINFGQEYRYKYLIRFFVYYKLMKKYRKRLSILLYQEKPDIVISTLGRELDFLTSIKDGSIKIGEAHTTKKHLRSLHLLEDKGFPYKIIAKYWRYKMEKNVKRLKKIVVLTNEDKESWDTITNSIVINNATTFYPKESSTCMNKQAIIVGRYNDSKGYEYLIEAWKIVYQRHPDWIINIYGSGEYQNAVQKAIYDNGLQHVMIMNEPTDDILHKYLNSSIYVMSSKYEGFGMVLLEAMSCGVPCVSFDCPYGPRNIIKNGEDGILVNYLDSNELAFKICLLIENEALRKKMGANAKKNIMRFSKEKIMINWIHLFSELIDECHQ